MGIMNFWRDKPAAISDSKKVSPGSGAAAASQHSDDPFMILNNPVTNLTPSYCVTILDQSDRGNYTMAQWILRYAEQLDADLLCVTERIDRAIQTLPWTIKVIEGADPVLAKEQVDFLREQYESFDNLETCIRFLASYRVKGYAHVFITTQDDKLVLTPMDQWWMVRDGLYGSWGYNPEASRCGYQSTMEINPDQWLIVETQRPLMKFCILKYLKSSFNERWWDKYDEIVSRQGTVIIAPENVENANSFSIAATAIAEGNSGWLPNGTTVEMPNNQRGTPPYKDRLQYLREQLILAVTGGLTTVLAVPTGMGSNIGEVQNDVWHVISTGIGLDVSEEFRRKIDKPLIKAKFPDQPVLAYFDLGKPLEKTTSNQGN